MIHRRGEQLRELPFEELKRLGGEPAQRVTVGARSGTIEVIVEELQRGEVRVVIRGFLKGRFLPWKDVAMDGFYRYPDGVVARMSPDEFYQFD